MNSMTQTDPRTEYIAGLRTLADVLEHMKDKRRAKNRQARASRRINRGQR